MINENGAIVIDIIQNYKKLLRSGQRAIIFQLKELELENGH